MAHNPLHKPDNEVVSAVYCARLPQSGFACQPPQVRGLLKCFLENRIFIPPSVEGGCLQSRQGGVPSVEGGCLQSRQGGVPSVEGGCLQSRQGGVCPLHKPDNEVVSSRTIAQSRRRSRQWSDYFANRTTKLSAVAKRSASPLTQNPKGRK